MATSRTGRPPVIRCRCWRRCDAVVVARSAHGERRIPFTEFYTGYRASLLRHGRADRRGRGPTRRRASVVPQGRDAGGAGDLEGGHGGGETGWSRSAAHRVRLRRPGGRSRARGRGRCSPRGGESTRAASALGAGDHADRRHSIDGGVPTSRRRESAAAVLDGDRERLTGGRRPVPNGCRSGAARQLRPPTRDVRTTCPCPNSHFSRSSSVTCSSASIPSATVRRRIDLPSASTT